MSDNVFASLGAIISALQANNCKLVNFSEAGEIIFETKQEGKIITAVLTNKNNSEESNFEVISENQSLIWKQNIEQQLNETIKAIYNNTSEHSNYDALAKRAIHAIGFDFNDDGELFKADNRPWHKKLLENFNPKHPFFVTYCIIAINILVFVAMAIYTLGGSFMFPNRLTMTIWGANDIGLISNGEYWRIFTSTFLHFGIIHLALNMFGLYNLGPTTEYFYKRKLFLFGYVTCGIVASIVSCWYNAYQVGAGASGAIFGVVGMLIGFSLIDKLPKEERAGLLKSLLKVVGLNLLISLSTSFVDNSAHIGGLLCGILISFGCSFFIKNNGKKLYQYFGILGMFAILGLSAYVFMPKAISNFMAFDKVMNPLTICENNLKDKEDNLDKYAEYYETVMVPTMDSTIIKLKNLNLNGRYKKQGVQITNRIGVLKKYNFFSIKYSYNKSDTLLRDSVKFYENKLN